MTVAGRRAALAIAALALAGCESIHSYDATRELSPFTLVSVSGSVGTTFDKRDRDGDGHIAGPKDDFKREKVLVPDARAEIRLKANPYVTLTFDPLPPAIGAGLVLHYPSPGEGAPSITFAPTVSYLVFPPQDVTEVEAPLALSWRMSKRWLLYAGPKGIWQSAVLKPEHGFYHLFMDGVHDRPAQDFRLFGGFAGFAWGYHWLQISPEVGLYKSVDDGEQIVQVGTQIRLSL